MIEEKKRRILVVDDHPKLLTFIGIDLKLRGYDVVSAGSGQDALDKVNSSKPDIVLLDMIMPVIDGFEVLKTLRTYSKIPVIAFSASPANREPAMLAGANDFMNKPFDLDDMAGKIKAFLDLKE